MRSARTGNKRAQDMRAMVRLVQSAAGGATVESVQHRRRLVAELCRMIGSHLTGTIADRTPPQPQPHAALAGLSPRMRQTLQRLLGGDSEKQIAARLGVSRHTVHVYVKGLYRRFNVASRGELLARFISPPPLEHVAHNHEPVR